MSSDPRPGSSGSCPDPPLPQRSQLVTTRSPRCSPRSSSSSPHAGQRTNATSGPPIAAISRLKLGLWNRSSQSCSITIEAMETELPLERRAAVHRALGDPHRLLIVDALRLSDRSPSELAARTGLGSNLVAFHLGVLEEAEVIERGPSEGDARRRYVHLQSDVLTALTPHPSLRADDVVFVCTANSARSQLAAALWERRTGTAVPARRAARRPRRCTRSPSRPRRHGLDLSTAVPRGYDALGAPPDLSCRSATGPARQAAVRRAGPALVGAGSRQRGSTGVRGGVRRAGRPGRRPRRQPAGRRRDRPCGAIGQVASTGRHGARTAARTQALDRDPVAPRPGAPLRDRATTRRHPA
jgi:ArsR family transcriptional regulator, arsenate/arsenite/antimonite-responsive transcriptional repressor / arsenate reductase (thioredoxin)